MLTIVGRGAWWRLRAAMLAGALVFLFLIDLGVAAPQARWPLAVAGMATTALSLWPGPLTARAVGAAACSGLVTAWLFGGGSPRTWGMAEAAALLLLIVAVRRSDEQRVALPRLLVLGAAVVAQGARLDGHVATIYSLLLAFPAIGAIALGGALRSGDQRKRGELAAVRQKERLDLARELHDFVAHHVTGIVVAAQAAQVTAQQDADAVRSALQAIERAGAEALTSMRQLVGVLRGEDACRPPGGALAQLRELVDGFTRSCAGPVATLDVGDALEAASVPAPLAATVYRIVAESLTNVRRHASSATTVRIAVDLAADSLRVCVRDDGHTSARPADSDGGFGLAGLAERVASLGGTLRAGPRPEGGWQILATLPWLGTRTAA